MNDILAASWDLPSGIRRESLVLPPGTQVETSRGITKCYSRVLQWSQERQSSVEQETFRCGVLVKMCYMHRVAMANGV